MLEVRITELNNDAFKHPTEGGIHEIARILRALAYRIEKQEFTGMYENLHDINGNPVGFFRLKIEVETNQ